jgi:hypothetical protein
MVMGSSSLFVLRFLPKAQDFLAPNWTKLGFSARELRQSKMAYLSSMFFTSGVSTQSSILHEVFLWLFWGCRRRIGGSIGGTLFRSLAGGRGGGCETQGLLQVLFILLECTTHLVYVPMTASPPFFHYFRFYLDE